jgi:hypothetical protein
LSLGDIISAQAVVGNRVRAPRYASIPATWPNCAVKRQALPAQMAAPFPTQRFRASSPRMTRAPQSSNSRSFNAIDYLLKIEVGFLSLPGLKKLS